ncbi:hypothetical protein ACFL1R_12475 [Candidatus Latescibacterota bacterium]
MRSKIFILMILLLVFGSGQVFGQATLTVTPTDVPKGAWVNAGDDDANDSHFWQMLKVVTGNPHTSGTTVDITLPIGMYIADIDDNTNFIEEVSVLYDNVDDNAGDITAFAVTSYNVVGPRVLRLTITGGAPAGEVGDIYYIMFPVTTDETPAGGIKEYLIDFSTISADDIDTGEGPEITYYDEGIQNFTLYSFLATMTGNDDVTSLYGEVWPEAGGLFSSSLADLVLEIERYLCCS